MNKNTLEDLWCLVAAVIILLLQAFALIGIGSMIADLFNCSGLYGAVVMIIIEIGMVVSGVHIFGEEIEN